MYYFKNEDVNKIDFYKVYKELFSNQNYKKLNSNAKWVYIILLDNLNIATVDNNGNLYLIIREQLQAMLGVSINTITKIFKDLSELRLLLEVKQQIGISNLIYPLKLKNIDLNNYHTNGKSIITICEPLSTKNINPNIPKVLIENFTDEDISKAEDYIMKKELQNIHLIPINKYTIYHSCFCENDIKMICIAMQIVIGTTKFKYADKTIVKNALIECKLLERKEETLVINTLVECIINLLNKEIENVSNN